MAENRASLVLNVARITIFSSGVHDGEAPFERLSTAGKKERGHFRSTRPMAERVQLASASAVSWSWVLGGFSAARMTAEACWITSKLSASKEALPW
jgi:hypothetical protein